MKCRCVKTCQYRGVTNEGAVLEMTEAEMKKPFVARHFVVVGARTSDFRSQISERGGAGTSDFRSQISERGGAGTFAVAAGGMAADDIRAKDRAQGIEVDGKIVPMTKRQIAQKLASFGVKVKPGATTEELYAALKEAQAPNLELA